MNDTCYSLFSTRHSNLLYALDQAETEEAFLKAARDLREYRAAVKTELGYGAYKAAPTEAMRILMDTLNGSFSRDGKEFAEAVDDQHRTIQQKFYGLVFQLIAHMGAKSESQTDARNWASWDTCRKIVEICEKERIHLGALPLI